MINMTTSMIVGAQISSTITEQTLRFLLMTAFSSNNNLSIKATNMIHTLRDLFLTVWLDEIFQMPLPNTTNMNNPTICLNLTIMFSMVIAMDTQPHQLKCLIIRHLETSDGTVPNRRSHHRAESLQIMCLRNMARLRQPNNHYVHLLHQQNRKECSLTVSAHLQQKETCSEIAH